MIEGILLAHPLSIPIREEGARTESKRRRVDWVGWRGRGDQEGIQSSNI